MNAYLFNFSRNLTIAGLGALTAVGSGTILAEKTVAQYLACDSQGRCYRNGAGMGYLACDSQGRCDRNGAYIEEHNCHRHGVRHYSSTDSPKDVYTNNSGGYVGNSSECTNNTSTSVEDASQPVQPVRPARPARW